MKILAANPDNFSMNYFTILNPFFHWKKVNCKIISEITCINVRTIRRYYKKFREGNPLPRNVRVGRPKKYSNKLNTQIAKCVSKDPSMASQEVSAKFNSSSKRVGSGVSARTVRRRLSEMDYKSKRPVTIPFLTEKHIKNRIQFQRKNKKTEWDTVIFSDEASFQVRQNIRKVWTKGKMVRSFPMKKFEDKVMVWGAISIKGKSELYFVEKSMDSEQYTRVIEHVLIPFMKTFHDDNVIFQQDNAPCHVSRASTKFISEKNIRTLDWPANSPDLSPIENLWGLLKRKVARRSPQNKKDLKPILEEEWAKITPAYCKRLVRSMPKRLLELESKKGRKINY